MKKLIIVVVTGLWIMGLAACHSASETNYNRPKPLTEKQLIRFNRQLLRQEKKEIDAYIRARHWKMKETGTGLRVEVLEKGKGPRARTGQIAVIRYSVKLFDGSEIYSGVKSFKIGYGRVESGLEEGILLMKKGEEARFILPSHLAYGLSGDGDKIPPHTPIIYRVKLIELK